MVSDYITNIKYIFTKENSVYFKLHIYTAIEFIWRAVNVHLHPAVINAL